MVRRLKTQFPEESANDWPDGQLHRKLAFVNGGALIHLPALLPGIGQAWSMLGLRAEPRH